MKRRSSTVNQKEISKKKGFGSFETQNSIQQDIKNKQEHQQNDDDQYKIEKQPYYFKQKYQKNYRKFDQKGIRKVKIIAYECLKSMKLKELFQYWSKKQEGQRNKRYIILLIIMILANEKQTLLKDFVKRYKKLCSDIIQRKNLNFQQDYNPQHFLSIKHHLQISIKAAQAFIQSNFDVDVGLKIMQNEGQPKYYLSAKKKLEEYKEIIKSNKHKKSQKEDDQI